MPKLLMLKGLPACGKTTLAREYVKSGWKRVNKDDLRAMLDSSVWSKSNEKFVIGVRDTIITAALARGESVVVDDTNFNPKHEKAFLKMAKDYGAEFEVKFINTPVEDCIKRDAARVSSVGRKVIMQMYNQYLKPPAPVIKYNPALPNAIIVDIDGTLAKMNGRGPFEWKMVLKDDLNEPIAAIVRKYGRNVNDRVAVILVSGRDEVCRPETQKWLEKNVVWYEHLFMRPEGNNEDDRIIKKAIYDEHIQGKYNVLFVLDDRDKVVQMWRDLGLTCLQVDSGDF